MVSRLIKMIYCLWCGRSSLAVEHSLKTKDSVGLGGELAILLTETLSLLKVKNRCLGYLTVSAHRSGYWQVAEKTALKSEKGRSYGRYICRG